eukprot:GAHX01001429.1.p1 GENE.GAHX01001429.1~~GAHX01001429.1.p1  ORF type:complete len:153 (+),score=17.38 GAHX01001429.1:105-563(+)
MKNRIHIEFRTRLYNLSIPGIKLYNNSEDLSSLSFYIEGPSNTPYQDGIFKLLITIPKRYPFEPPLVKFETRIFHPNIDTEGRICLDILKMAPNGSWTPALNIVSTLLSIQVLLSNPNPEDGVGQESSSLYLKNKKLFDKKAKEITEKYAKG